MSKDCLSCIILERRIADLESLLGIAQQDEVADLSDIRQIRDSGSIPEDATELDKAHKFIFEHYPDHFKAWSVKNDKITNTPPVARNPMPACKAPKVKRPHEIVADINDNSEFSRITNP